MAGSTFGDSRGLSIVINSAVFVLTNNALPLLFSFLLVIEGSGYRVLRDI